MTVPLSILDLAPISEGSDAATALRNTVDLAQHAEQWGYKRYWIAEHHFVAVAGSSPAVLIGQIAAATEHIHVGAAAVQLGHTTAAAVVESFGILDAFHPGRIDLGVGRSGQKHRETADQPSEPKSERTTEWRDIDDVIVPPPFDPRSVFTDRFRAQMSILQQPEAVSPSFADQVEDILAMLHGCYRVNGYDVHVVPGERTSLTPWVFGSSTGQSAQVAGARGLPFVASYHITPGTALDAIDAYRATFSRGGGAAPYPDPDAREPLTDEQLAVVKDRVATQFVGDADVVAERLDTLQRVTGADELVITSVTHRHSDRLHSHELIAKRWGLL